jgi:hypothetical protein
VAEFEAARAKQLVHAGIVVEGTYEDTVREVEEVRADGGAVEEEKADEHDEETLTEEQYRAELNAQTKAELVALAKSQLGLELNEANKKDELIDAIVAATVKK